MLSVENASVSEMTQTRPFFVCDHKIVIVMMEPTFLVSQCYETKPNKWLVEPLTGCGNTKPGMQDSVEDQPGIKYNQKFLLAHNKLQ